MPTSTNTIGIPVVLVVVGMPSELVKVGQKCLLLIIPCFTPGKSGHGTLYKLYGVDLLYLADGSTKDSFPAKIVVNF